MLEVVAEGCGISLFMKVVCKISSNGFLMGFGYLNGRLEREEVGWGDHLLQGCGVAMVMVVG